MVTAGTLVGWLRELDRRSGASALPVIRMAIDEGAFDWTTLPACTDCGCPGLDVGQDHDCRYATDGPDGLHAQVFTRAGVVEFHLDRANACRDLLAHGFADTHLGAGAGGGALTGLILGGIFGGKKGALWGAGVGAALGAIAGRNVPRAPRVVHPFRSVLNDWEQFGSVVA